MLAIRRALWIFAWREQDLRLALIVDMEIVREHDQCWGSWMVAPWEVAESSWRRAWINVRKQWVKK